MPVILFFGRVLAQVIVVSFYLWLAHFLFEGFLQSSDEFKALKARMDNLKNRVDMGEGASKSELAKLKKDFEAFKVAAEAATSDNVVDLEKAQS